MTDIDNINLQVEVENADVDPMPGVFTAAYWVATVLRIAGYKVKQIDSKNLR